MLVDVLPRHDSTLALLQASVKPHLCRDVVPTEGAGPEASRAASGWKVCRPAAWVRPAGVGARHANDRGGPAASVAVSAAVQAEECCRAWQQCEYHSSRAWGLRQIRLAGSTMLQGVTLLQKLGCFRSPLILVIVTAAGVAPRPLT
jgi:hypothetical protein